MGWPKGVPRKGYVKKSKTVDVSRASVGIDAKSTVPRKGKVHPDLSNMQQEGEAPKADPATPVLHGMIGNGAITEPCPRCMYAYADGGYCPDCGWSKPIRLDEYGTHSGGRL